MSTITATSNSISLTASSGIYLTGSIFTGISNNTGSFNSALGNITLGYSNWNINNEYEIEILGGKIKFEYSGLSQDIIVFITTLNTIGYKFWENYKKLGVEIYGMPDVVEKFIEARYKILKRNDKIKDITKSEKGIKNNKTS